MKNFRLNPPNEFAGFNVDRIADIEALIQKDIIFRGRETNKTSEIKCSSVFFSGR